MAKHPRKGDIGTIIRLTVKVNGVALDISNANIKQIKLDPPSGSLLTKNASFTTDGKDGKIQYVTQLGDLAVAGKWIVQGYIEAPDGKWHTTQRIMEVEDNVA